MRKFLPVHHLTFRSAIGWLIWLLLVAVALAGGWWWGDWQGKQAMMAQVEAHEAEVALLRQQLMSQSEQLEAADEQIQGYQEYLVTQAPVTAEAQHLTGYQLPIEGVVPPYDNPAAMPSSSRLYRGGIHEGIDFPAVTGTPVRAVGAGRVIRIDNDYREPSAAKLQQLSQLTMNLGFTPEDILDVFRGRQVWLLLPGNVVVRYCHLSSVTDIGLGQTVEAGTVLGTVGTSGTLDGAQHLHFEIRTGSTYLGSGMTYQQMVDQITRFFSGA